MNYEPYTLQKIRYEMAKKHAPKFHLYQCLEKEDLYRSWTALLDDEMVAEEHKDRANMKDRFLLFKFPDVKVEDFTEEVYLKFTCDITKTLKEMLLSKRLNNIDKDFE